MLLESVTKDLKRSPSTQGSREVPRPAPAQNPMTPQAASAGPVATPSSPPPPTFRAAPQAAPAMPSPASFAPPTPVVPPAPVESPLSAFAPPSAPVAPAPLPQVPGLVPASSPFAPTSRGEIGTHPAAERAERNAPAPPTFRSIQKEGPGPVMDHGTSFQKSIPLPAEDRLARPAAAGEPLVVPITLDGSVREIVLRIVIEQKESADHAA